MSISWQSFIGALMLFSSAGSTSYARPGGSLGESALRMHDADNDGFFGMTVAALGDVNADGVRDYAIGEPIINEGHAHVYSGASGDLLYIVAANEVT